MTIGHDVPIAHGLKILAGATVGTGAGIVAALKWRFAPHQAETLQQIAWWEEPWRAEGGLAGHESLGY
ncbi:hypothetical protein CCR83_07015 [Rhodobacter veldkampii DSM 11550]|uniref:Uncharacterized protein n=1 Tax=Phaeovulum veldkampii DSM 11550 TaxID=1185920 RepID=A0A2T4JHI0_9RHOB|nr:hypothetical protein [Phaeovulum veldkampii]MBK5946205.1 hypothetical protein [Phaeovulum veldkampii DSM 11550]PTE17374.1 hypothetical protein C5F46_09670 [Phaeovulum veldkampii DSM 11550]